MNDLNTRGQPEKIHQNCEKDYAEQDASDRVRWNLIIHCGDLIKGAVKRTRRYINASLY